MNNHALKRHVFPVIHYLNDATTQNQAEIAFRAGADGIFLISHNGQDAALFEPALAIKANYPDKLVGLNLLSMSAFPALRAIANAGLDMVWTDNPGVTSDDVTMDAQHIEDWLALHPDGPRFFGSVAFKYQPLEPLPGDAAHLGASMGMLPTTSGTGTGCAPEVAKIASMSAALGGGELAVASGMTADNVAAYLPYITHYLVATGVSVDMHHVDEVLLTKFIQIVHGDVDA